MNRKSGIGLRRVSVSVNLARRFNAGIKVNHDDSVALATSEYQPLLCDEAELGMRCYPALKGWATVIRRSATKNKSSLVLFHLPNQYSATSNQQSTNGRGQGQNARSRRVSVAVNLARRFNVGIKVNHDDSVALATSEYQSSLRDEAELGMHCYPALKRGATVILRYAAAMIFDALASP